MTTKFFPACSECDNCGEPGEGDWFCVDHPKARVDTIAAGPAAPGGAAERIERLIGEREVIDTQRRLYNGHAVVIHTLVGNPDSDESDYYADEVAVAWDAALDQEPGVGACYVNSGDLATWLSLRFPCTLGGAGFARDGQWYEDGRDTVRRG